MRPWLGPIVLGVAVAAVTCWTAISYIPFGLMNVAIDRLGQGGVNVMAHGRLATADRQPIVRPSPDLVYSTCPFDLSGGPLAIDVVPVPGRYSSLSIFDAATDVIFVRNDQQVKEKPYRIIVARRGQAAPSGVEVVRTDHDRGIALIRLLLKEPAEIQDLDDVRQQSSCAPVTKLK